MASKGKAPPNQGFCHGACVRVDELPLKVCDIAAARSARNDHFGDRNVRGMARGPRRHLAADHNNDGHARHAADPCAALTWPFSEAVLYVEPRRSCPRSEIRTRRLVIRALALVLLVLSVAACDVQRGPSTYNNPPPGVSNLPSRQGHSSCPSGYTIC
jgi:hypothetical protein